MPLDRSLWEFLRLTLGTAVEWLEAHEPEQEGSSETTTESTQVVQETPAGPSEPARYSWREDQKGALSTVSTDSETVSGYTEPPEYESDPTKKGKAQLKVEEVDEKQQARRRHLISVTAAYREYPKYYERFGRSCCWTCNSPVQRLNHRCQTSHGTERQHCSVHQPRTCPLR